MPLLKPLNMREKWGEFGHDDQAPCGPTSTRSTTWRCSPGETSPEQIDGLAAAASKIAQDADFSMSDDGNLVQHAGVPVFEQPRRDQEPLMQQFGPLMSTLGGGDGSGAATPALQR